MLGSVQRATLIVNPYSSSVTDAGIEAVEAALRDRIELRTLRTAAPGHAVELASEAAADGAVVVYSGDGGFNEALNGLGVDVPVGFIPGGRTNVLSRALGLPRDPVDAARHVAEALERGRTRRISLGRVNGRRFGFGAGSGVDSEVVRELETIRRGRDGLRSSNLAYARVIAQRLLRGYEPRLEVDGLGRAALLFVSNDSVFSYAGPLPLRFAPQAKFELGIDVTAPARANRATAVRMAARLAIGRGLADASGVLSAHDVDRVVVRCDGPLPLQADGEDLGDVEGARFEAEPDALAVLV